MGLYKGRKRVKYTNFFMLGREMILHCDEWRQLIPSAKILYLYIKAKHTGTNNNGILMHYSELKAVRGLSSPATVSKAFRELESKGWITRVSLGGMFRIPNKYGLTGKYDYYITDRSLTVGPLPPPPQPLSNSDNAPEKYKESSYSVVQKPWPIKGDPPDSQACPSPSEPVRATESEEEDSKNCS